MNVGSVIVEQLAWDGSVRTVVQRPRQGAPDMWIAGPDEYDAERAGPFHFLSKQDERAFRRDLRRSANRPSRNFRRDGESFEYRSEWRGVPTESHAMSAYAFCLPPGAVPEALRCSDPRRANFEFAFRAVRDEQHGWVTLYLECRSRHGSFDFDLFARFRNDPRALERFEPILPPNEFGPDLDDMTEMIERQSSFDGDRVDRREIHQFLAGSALIQAGPGSVVLHGSTVTGNVVAAANVGAVGDGAQVHGNPYSLIDAQRRLVVEQLEQILRHAPDDETNTLLHEAVDAVDRGDNVSAVGALKRLGLSGLQLARDVGADIAAAVIAAALDIR